MVMAIAITLMRVIRIAVVAIFNSSRSNNGTNLIIVVIIKTLAIIVIMRTQVIARRITSPDL